MATCFRVFLQRWGSSGQAGIHSFATRAHSFRAVPAGPLGLHLWSEDSLHLPGLHGCGLESAWYWDFSFLRGGWPETLLAVYRVCMSVLTCRESDEACLHPTTTCCLQLPTYADFLSLKWDLGVPWITEEVQREISPMFFLVYGHCLLWSCGCLQWVLEWGWLRDRNPGEVASLQ